MLESSEKLKNNVLQHLFVNSFLPAEKSLLLPYLKTSDLAILLKISYKKVSRMFGQFVESVYLCIRNREGYPLRVQKERVL